MRLTTLGPGSSQRGLGAIMGAALLVVGAFASAWMKLGLPPPACVFRTWTDWPCPTCGTTRLLAALLRGDVTEALSLNPLVLVSVAGMAGWAVASAGGVLLGLPARHLVTTSRERLVLRCLAAAVLAVGWSYLAWRGV